jgi:hypothetical protein
MWSWRACGVCALGVVWLVACGDGPRRGGAGESCTSADDCKSGLACVAQVCVEGRDGGDGPGGGPGAACGARRDCAAGYACVSGACQAQSAGMQPAGNRYSGAGETCQAKNDCEGDLVCQSSVCRPVELALDRTPKSCHRIECATADDCCKSFVPNPNCDTYEQNCKTDPVFCATYRSLCVCSQDCVDDVCVAGAPGCMDDGECTSQQTPFCVDNKCRQCASDGDCPGMDAQCVGGACMAACAVDENCPLLHACVDKACVETGCKSDRECAFLTKDVRGACKAGKCTVPCEQDADCASPPGVTPSAERAFEVCEAGECKFVGCDDDAQCRALFDLQNMPGNVRAVCK